MGGPARELHWFAALKVLATGVLLSAIMVGASDHFLHTPTGDIVKEATYKFIQLHLRPDEPASHITVVDISDLAPNGNGVTPRDPLINLVNAIAEQRPRAIGVDIDFSRDGDRLADPEDIKALSSFKALSTPSRPILVGVHRALGRDRNLWFLLPEYSDLGAPLLIPKDTRLYVRDLGNKDESSMVLKLADSEKPQPSTCWFCVKPIGAGVGAMNQAYTDFSIFERLQREAVHLPQETFKDLASIKTGLAGETDKLKNSIVLIGDIKKVANRDDSFPNPVQGESSPGVLLQAAGVYTALTKPLSGVSEWQERFIDIAIALFGILFLAGVALTRPEGELQRSIFWLSRFFGLLVLTVGMAYNFSRVLWESFFVVAAFQFLHPHAHGALERFLEGEGLGKNTHSSPKDDL